MADNTTTWVIDPSHSTVGFVVRHLVSKVRGQFGEFSGQIMGNPEDLSDASATFTVEMQSVNTNQADRDNHLRTSDFFDVENYPTMTFSSTRVEKTDTNTYTVYGNLTLRGVTKEIPVHVEFLGIAPDPWGNTRAGFEASARINRKDFGVNWNQVLEAGGVMVGDNVDIHLELETIQQ
ncbi:YceI family protein [Sulfobacillus harzensis]|uniref:Polyisoprenoid-binding protein n=1 Tax=Sulfobacillus harzensis TaxID=2729629 RepID=A0A7Y0L2W5_9FIRM|nr:YceI family protein [Sulfobacillus harzensis]NMP22296.1 polyisoprenoid-binding protein [Sulfobacillus harzensis]